MYETSKAVMRRLHDNRFATRFLVGDGIDIGAGTDLLRGRLKNKFQIVLVQIMAITDKAGDANQRTVSKQFHQQRMGDHPADVTWATQAGSTAALHPTQCRRSHPLYCAQRLRLADDAA
jgi:hypothetical protein